MKLLRSSSPAFLVALLCVGSRAQTLDARIAPDTATSTTTMQFTATGPGGGVCLLFIAESLVRGVPTPYGLFFLDPASLVTLATFPLNLSGSGSVTYRLPWSLFDKVSFDVQGLVVGGVASPALTNYQLLGHNVGLTDVARACGVKYDPKTGSVRVLGYASANDQIDVVVMCPPLMLPQPVGRHIQQAEGQFDRSFPCNFMPGCQMLVLFNGAPYIAGH